MKNSKALLVALLLVLALGATTASAQIAGTWKGTGTGDAYPYSSVVIHPWQSWKGEIPNSQDVFTGDWYDADGNHGTFRGTPVPSIPEVVVFKGSWYWFDPASPSSRPRYGGDFEMTFHFMEGYYCEGIWTTIWPSSSDQGTMRGRKVWTD